jgi:hypothetical protein
MAANFNRRQIVLTRTESSRMTYEIKDQRHRVDRSANGAFLAFWCGQVVYENGHVKRFETESEAWEFLSRCDAAGKIIH